MAPPGTLSDSTSLRVQRSALVLQDNLDDDDSGKSLWCGGACMGGRRGDRGSARPGRSSIRTYDSLSAAAAASSDSDGEHLPALLSALSALRSALSALTARSYRLLPQRPQTILVDGKPAQLRAHLKTRRPARSILRNGAPLEPPGRPLGSYGNGQPAAGNSTDGAVVVTAATAAALLEPPTPEVSITTKAKRLRFADEIGQQPSSPWQPHQQEPQQLQQWREVAAAVGDGRDVTGEVVDDGTGGVGAGGCRGESMGTNATVAEYDGGHGRGGDGDPVQKYEGGTRDGARGGGSGLAAGEGGNGHSGSGLDASSGDKVHLLLSLPLPLPLQLHHAGDAVVGVGGAAAAAGAAGTTPSWRSVERSGRSEAAGEQRSEKGSRGGDVRAGSERQESSRPLNESASTPNSPPETPLMQSTRTGGARKGAASACCEQCPETSAQPPGAPLDLPPCVSGVESNATGATGAAPAATAAKAASLLTRLRLMGTRDSAVAPVEAAAAASSCSLPGSPRSGGGGGGGSSRALVQLLHAAVASTPPLSPTAASAAASSAATPRIELQPRVASKRVMFNDRSEPGPDNGPTAAAPAAARTASSSSYTLPSTSVRLGGGAGNRDGVGGGGSAPLGSANAAAAGYLPSNPGAPVQQRGGGVAATTGAGRWSPRRLRTSLANASAAWMEPVAGPEDKGSRGGGSGVGSDGRLQLGVEYGVEGGAEGGGDAGDAGGGGDVDGLSTIQVFRGSLSASELRIYRSDHEDGEGDGDGDGGECDAEELLQLVQQQGAAGCVAPQVAAAAANTPCINGGYPASAAVALCCKSSYAADLACGVQQAVRAVQPTPQQRSSGRPTDAAARRSQQIRAAPFATAIGLLQKQQLQQDHLPPRRGSGSDGRGFPFRSPSSSSSFGVLPTQRPRSIPAGSLSISNPDVATAEEAAVAAAAAADASVNEMNTGRSSPLPASRFSPQPVRNRDSTARWPSQDGSLAPPPPPPSLLANGLAVGEAAARRVGAARAEAMVTRSEGTDGWEVREGEGEEQAQRGEGEEDAGDLADRSARDAAATDGGDGTAPATGLPATRCGASGLDSAPVGPGDSDSSLPMVPAAASARRGGGRSSLDLSTRLAQTLKARLGMTNCGPLPYSRRGRSSLDMSALLERAVAVRQGMTSSGVEPGQSAGRGRGEAVGSGLSEVADHDGDCVSEGHDAPFAAVLSLLQHQSQQRPALRLRTASTTGGSFTCSTASNNGYSGIGGAKAAGWVSVPQTSVAVPKAPATAAAAPLGARFRAASTCAVATADGDGCAAIAQRAVLEPASRGSVGAGGRGGSRQASLVILPGGIETADGPDLRALLGGGGGGGGGPGDSGDGSCVNLHRHGRCPEGRGGAVLTAAGAGAGACAPVLAQRRGVRRCTTASVLVSKGDQLDTLALIRQLDERDRLEAVEALLS